MCDTLCEGQISLIPADLAVLEVIKFYYHSST